MRHFSDWLEAFVEYASYGEAPKHVYFWVGAWTVAGALRRRVWLDQVYFQWYPNLYVVLVAPPGIISKSTSADMGASLLRRVAGIRFGPSVVTWQALVQAFCQAAEAFEYGGEWHTMSPLSIVSSEFGNLLNPADREMVDMLVNLWDGRSFEKRTKTFGSEDVINPWINLLACTTPEWISGSFPEYMIGGGFTSRCVFVYVDQKARYVPYPALEVPADLGKRVEQLVEDLAHIAKLVGPFQLTPDAIEWGRAWYEEHYRVHAPRFDPALYGAYAARKQTHIHKLGMIISAAQRDTLQITAEDLALADTMLTMLEPTMPKVFERIGRRPEGAVYDRIVGYIQARGRCTVAEVCRAFAQYFPRESELTDVLRSVVKSGQARLVQENGVLYYEALKG